MAEHDHDLTGLLGAVELGVEPLPLRIVDVPLRRLLYDAAVPGQAEQAEHLATAIVELCVEQGGSITGEHGVGSDKACSMLKMFSSADLTVMARIRAAFDPQGICNPGAAAVRGTPRPLPTPPAGVGGRHRADVRCA